MNRTESQRKRILRHLQAMKPITAIEALNLYGCFRLSARIKDLRDEGYNIKTETINTGGKQFAKYTLIDKEVISEKERKLIEYRANQFYYFRANINGQESAIQLTVDNFEEHYLDFIAQKYRMYVPTGSILREYLHFVKEEAESYLKSRKYHLVSDMLVNELESIIKNKNWDFIN